MQFTCSKTDLIKHDLDILVVTAKQQDGDDTAAQLQRADGGLELDKLLDGQLTALCEAEKFSGALGKTRLIPLMGSLGSRYILLLGIGKADTCSTHDWRRLGGIVQRCAKEVRASSAGAMFASARIGKLDLATRVRAFAEGMLLANYRYDACKSDPKPAPALEQFTIVSKDTSTCKKAVRTAEILSGAITTTRDLTNAPSNICTPQYMAETARKIAKDGKIECKVLGKAGIAKEKMGLLQAVSQGGNNDPVFIHLSYRPSGKAKKRIAIIGKGITFDTGGYSIKIRDAMVGMRGDMGGGAAALGIMQAVAALKPKVALDVYVPACENVVSAEAYRPDDVITARNGKTVEIISTDAEGRLIMADALDYAAEREPDLIIDMATLTGAVAYAVGEIYTAAMGTDQKMIDRLLKSSEQVSEPMWQLPLVDKYRNGLTRNTNADTRNSGTSRAGTITAALFLQQFVRNVPWIHLDIAYSSWADEEDSYTPRGASGNPVRTLTEFIMAL